MKEFIDRIKNKDIIVVGIGYFKSNDKECVDIVYADYKSYMSYKNAYVATIREHKEFEFDSKEERDKFLIKAELEHLMGEMTKDEILLFKYKWR